MNVVRFALEIRLDKIVLSSAEKLQWVQALTTSKSLAKWVSTWYNPSLSDEENEVEMLCNSFKAVQLHLFLIVLSSVP